MLKLHCLVSVRYPNFQFILSLPRRSYPRFPPVKLLVALKYVDDYSFIQIRNATIGLGIMPRI